MDRLRLLIENIVVVVILKIANILWPNENENLNISYIIESGLGLVQYYALRIQYSFEEYQQHRIPRTFKRLRKAILIFSNGCWTVIFLVIFVCTEESSLWISTKYLEKIIDCERLDLLIISVIILIIIGEWTLFIVFIQILNYRFSIQKVLYKNLSFDDGRLSTNNRRYLMIYYLFIKIAAYGFAGGVIIGIAFTYVMEIYFLTQSYLNNQITILQLVFSMVIFIQIILHVSILIILALIATFTVGYFLEFFKVRMKQLHSFLKQDELSKYIPKMKYSWNCIQREYVELYDETASINKTLSLALYSLDTVSKILSITSCVFYSRQIKMNASSALALLGMMLVFIYTSALYTRLVYPPKYNHHYCKLLLNRLARNSTTKNFIFKQNNRITKTIVKSNLFIQIMNNNQFGYHCGHVFFITKFQVVELFMMNLPLITLFYKKICMQ